MSRFTNIFSKDKSLLFADYGFKFPRYNLEAYPGEYVYHFDIPGVKKDDVKVYESEGNLVIKGNRDMNNSGSEFIYSESKFGEFERSIKLEQDAVPDECLSKLVNGVLKVSFTRKQVIKDIPEIEEKRRKITIE